MDSPRYKIVHEQLDIYGMELRNIYFRYGGNFFVFSYLKGSFIKHTLS